MKLMVRRGAVQNSAAISARSLLGHAVGDVLQAAANAPDRRLGAPSADRNSCTRGKVLLSTLCVRSRTVSLTLYYHPLSSFCHKVLIALYEKSVEFERRIINLADAGERAELQRVSPIGKFPVIRDHARKRDLPETSIIIEYLDQHYSPELPLIPHEPDTALEVRLWDRVFDLYVQGPMNRIVGDRLRGTNGNLAQERSILDTAYVMVDRQLGSQTWVAGQAFSMADCAAAPALFYASTVHAFPDDLDRLSAYFDRLMERPSVRRVLEEARPYFPLYPFADTIPQRFL